MKIQSFEDGIDDIIFKSKSAHPPCFPPWWTLRTPIQVAHEQTLSGSPRNYLSSSPISKPRQTKSQSRNLSCFQQQDIKLIMLARIFWHKPPALGVPQTHTEIEIIQLRTHDRKILGVTKPFLHCASILHMS